jgi:hypothetical protein
MSDRELSRLFDELAPPPGGLADLRDRLRGREVRRRRTLRLAAAFAGAAALAIVVVWLALPTPTREPAPWLSRSDLYAVHLGVVEPPSEPVTVPPDQRGEIAVRRVPTSDERVVFYRVGVR